MHGLFLSTLLVTTPGGDTWPGFRGDGSGISMAQAMPVRWTPETGIAWRVDVPGYGQSSPVIWHGRVFVTSVEGPQMDRCMVHAFNLDDGTLLWSREFPASQSVENYFRNSRAAPTCVVDEDAPHDLGAHSAEVRAALPVDARLIHELHVRLVDERGRL